LEIAEQIKVRGYKDPRADVFKRVYDWLRYRYKKNERQLLVLDNAHNAGVLSPLDNGADGSTGGSRSSSALQRYLPPSAHGSALVS
jgi:hypothetical protein